MANHGSTSSSGPAVPPHGTGQMHVPPPTISQHMTSSHNKCACCALTRKHSIWVSTVLIFSGVLGIAGAGIGFHSSAPLSETGAGIWCALVFLTTGSVAIAAGRYRTIPLMRATVAHAVLSIAFAISLLTIGYIGVLNNSYSCQQNCNNSYNSCYCDYYLENMKTAANVVLLASGWLAFIFALWLLIIALISLRAALKPHHPRPKAKKLIVKENKVTPTPSVIPSHTQSPSLQQQTMTLGSQSQPIIIFTTHTHPTVLFGHQFPQGQTIQSQVQPVVFMGQQGQQPTVASGNQSQPTVVFRQDPQDGVTINIQTLPAVHQAENQSLPPKNLIDNHEASHEGK